MLLAAVLTAKEYWKKESFKYSQERFISYFVKTVQLFRNWNEGCTQTIWQYHTLKIGTVYVQKFCEKLRIDQKLTSMEFISVCQVISKCEGERNQFSVQKYASPSEEKKCKSSSPFPLTHSHSLTHRQTDTHTHSLPNSQPLSHEHTHSYTH